MKSLIRIVEMFARRHRDAISAELVEEAAIAGPLTAKEAFQLASASALSLDSRAYLRRIQSDLSVKADGRAQEWEFLFGFPSLESVGQVSVGPTRGDSPNETMRIGIRIVGQLEAAAKDWVPWEFEDSPVATRQFADAGIAFRAEAGLWSLSAERGEGGAALWIAQSVEDALSIPFSSEEM